MPRKKMSSTEWRTLLDEESTRCKSFDGKVSVNVSGGAGSAIAWKRCLEWYGKDRVEPVFADTKAEDPDLYRFLDDLENVFDQKITRLEDGRDLWQVFFDYRMIKVAHAGGACKASIELKHKPLHRHFKESGCNAIAVGVEGTEPERMKAFRDKLGCVLFPLACRPILSECDIKEEVKELGVQLPSLYDDGYAHNNCAGFCVLAGLGQWAANAKRDPEKFEVFASKEQEFMKLTGSTFTILKDQRGEEATPYSLREMQADIEDGREFPQDWKSQCACMTPQPKLFSIDDCI